MNVTLVEFEALRQINASGKKPNSMVTTPKQHVLEQSSDRTPVTDQVYYSFPNFNI